MGGLAILFGIILGIGALLFLLSGESGNLKMLGVGMIIVSVGLIIFGINTPSVQLQWNKMTTSVSNHTWLVVDNSGGKTLRHWVIDGYVTSIGGSDGWQFEDEKGNLVYVGGDAFLIKVNQAKDEFLKTYKKKFNIPVEQEALH